jgi:hypothetical protein
VDLRERIARWRTGVPRSVAARTFGVARATVQRYVEQQAAPGSLAPRPTPGPAHVTGAAAAVRAAVRALPRTPPRRRGRPARPRRVRQARLGLHDGGLRRRPGLARPRRRCNSATITSDIGRSMTDPAADHCPARTSAPGQLQRGAAPPDAVAGDARTRRCARPPTGSGLDQSSVGYITPANGRRERTTDFATPTGVPAWMAQRAKTCPRSVLDQDGHPLAGDREGRR